MSELAQDLHLKEIEPSTRLIDRVERQLNGELAGVPTEYWPREEFEDLIQGEQIPVGSNAAIILVDVRRMAKINEALSETRGDNHLRKIREETGEWGEEIKECFLASNEGSDEIEIFLLMAEGKNQIKEEVKKLVSRVVEVIDNQIFELVDKQAPLALGAVIIEGNGKTMNPGSIKARLREANQLLQKAKEENKLALVSTQYVAPESHQTRDFQKMEVLEYQAGEIRDWVEEEMVVKVSPAPKGPSMAKEVYTNISSAREELKKQMKEEGLFGLIFSITNFGEINKRGHDVGDGVLADFTFSIIRTFFPLLTIKLGTNFLVVFYEKPERLMPNIEYLKQEFQDLLQTLGLPKEKIKLFGVGVNVQKTREEKFSLQQTGV